MICVALAWVPSVLAVGGWADPDGGWDLVIDFDDYPDPLLADDNAALDGNWSHDNGSDQWDGSRPGEGNPGGVALEIVPGGSEDGSDAVVLTLEDTGDPRNDGFADPGSNRKMYFVQDLGSPGVSIFDAGVTLAARWRIHPNPTEAPSDGYTLHDGGKGQIGVVSEVGGVVNVSMALDTGVLNFVGDNQLAGINDTDFQAVWLTAINVADGVQVDIYLNGSDSAAFSGVVTPGDGSDGSLENYLAVGLGSTGRDGAIQIDSISYRNGVFAPAVGTAVEPVGKLATQWGALKSQ